MFCAVALGLGSLGTTVFAPTMVVQAGEQAAVQTRTFTVEKMTCAACPVTVKAAMSRVEGVRSVEVDFESKTATVTFDPAVTTADEIAQASANAGYPAQVAES